MQEEISYSILVISVGLTAFGIMIAISLRKIYPVKLISALIYYQAFVFAFGFYGLWGQAVFMMYIKDLLNEAMRERISMVATLQGFPFMILGWYMLVRFIRELYQRKTGIMFNAVFLVFSAVSFVALIWFISQPDSDSNYFYSAFYTILSLIIQAGIAVSLIFISPKNKRVDKRKLFFLAIFICLLTAIQLSILNFSDMTAYYGLGFILSFFVLHAGITIIIRYSNLLKPFTSRKGQNISFESYCKEHEISPREIDIIREICNGHTNKEISERLFISVQTVKDHTHRIYIKTGVRNRVDLINSLKEIL
ncbi:MAG: helix-turn-helix transcriptional regulator [Marinilabiliaceae bacterium]|nr:helix-turn-helix transcriptional regulator [Marinilabiliaceae bacterium]